MTEFNEVIQMSIIIKSSLLYKAQELLKLCDNARQRIFLLLDIVTLQAQLKELQRLKQC